MENTGSIDQLQESLKKYINTRYELAALKAAEKVSVVGASAVSGLLIGVMLLLFLLFISVAAGFYLGALLGSTSLGFLVLAGFYLLVGLVLLAGKKKLIIGPVRDKIIKEMFDED